MENAMPLNLIERFNRWLQESIMIKLFSIGFLILILLIPSSWIDDLIRERQQRADEVLDEVADKWSGNQTLSGPILVIPFRKVVSVEKEKGVETTEMIDKAYFLPAQLDVSGNVKPEILHRGIFDAVVYKSKLDVKATFGKPDFKSLSIDDNMVLWNDASMVIGISDVRGISDDPVFKAGEKPLALEPSSNIGLTVSKTIKPVATEYDLQAGKKVASSSGVMAKLGWSSADDFNGDVMIDLNLKGSKRLDFIPVGKTTSVKISGDWNNPSFDGEFLPESRQVSGNNFSAAWKILHFNRPFSQQWAGSGEELSGSNFGVKLLIPVDQYQKSIRTSKYGILIILLTFVALFLVEIVQKIRIHPFQYILIGVALTIYYTLLISFSEHVGYDIAYLISSLATVILISAYSTTFFQRAQLVALLTVLLVVFYTFIYVIILQQDFSLLLGSIGLFLIVAALMYFSRKVNWYKGV